MARAERMPDGAETDTDTGTRRRASPPSRRGAALVALVLGGLLIGLGGPRLVAALLTLEARAVLWEVYGGRPVAEPRLIAAAEAIAAAGRWVRDGELETDRGLLLARAAESLPPGEARRHRLAEARSATEAGLAAAPGQPVAWARLAGLYQQAGDPAAAVRALRMSMLAGAVVPALQSSRIELGLPLLPAMDAETLELFRRQIGLTWVMEPDFIIALGARPGLAALVRDGLDGLGGEEMARFAKQHPGRP